jgi:hypothetical protein
VPPAGSDIDRLIEEGLDRYGTGDLDGALLRWEEALALDPDNEQANSYVDYVRMNYELLVSSATSLADDDSAFALPDEPEYAIEIVPGELEPGQAAVSYTEAGDAGWIMGDEVVMNGAARPQGQGAPDAEHGSDSNSGSDPGMTIELEADEPVRDSEPDFESATREYGSDRLQQSGFATPEPATSEFQREAATGSFTSEGTPVGFSAEATELKPRELGFVQPSDPGPAVQRAAPEPAPSAALAPAPSAAPDPAPSAQPEPAVAPAEHEHAAMPPPSADPTTELPVVRIRTPTDNTARSVRAESELPVEVVEPSVSASPTIDLGLRGARPVTARPITETDDAPTRESDASAFRAQAAARSLGRSNTEIGIGITWRPGTDTQETTTTFDPIELRASQILTQVDDGAPADEAPDERTRRRIASLLAHAMACSGIGELERGVTAAELALSEDPESAVAQKLVHRNRDALMGVFQTYIGDLDRQPQLAKPLSELAGTSISPRAAFLLSRIDGMLSVDEILDVSGMPRLEAYRYLCQLLLRGVLK